MSCMSPNKNLIDMTKYDNIPVHSLFISTLPDLYICLAPILYQIHLNPSIRHTRSTESPLSRLSKEMEVQENENAMLHQGPLLMVNPTSPPLFGSPWVSKSALFFSSSLRYGQGSSAQHGDSHWEGIEMEFMFSKMLTQSDVSKLNRLLIPRKEAKKYFPMGSGAIDQEGASFLNFEDSDGKLWHFRYSFWESSKTYVLTKGWVRFVKEKRLTYGDTVSFYQRVSDATGINRRFIFFKKQEHGSSMACRVPANIITNPFGTHDDNWLLKAFGSSGHYRANLVQKQLSYGSVGTMPPNFPTPQPPLIAQGTSLGSGMGSVEKPVLLFGVDLNANSNESFCDHGHTNGVA
jgi:hypothetical protein